MAGRTEREATILPLTPRTEPCDCLDQGFPLASFCDDDLFCPQCGGAVAWLLSPENEFRSPDDPNRRTLWVYPARTGQGPAEFKVTLRFRSLDQARRPQARTLRLDPVLSKVEAPTWFEPLMEIVPSDHEDGRVECRLRPSAQLVERWENEWYRELPAEGVAAKLTLIGNCGERRFLLRVFNKPEFEVEIRDEGVLPVGPADDRCWSLSRRGPQDLTISIRPTNGFVYLPNPKNAPEQVNDSPPGTFCKERALPLDKILKPDAPGDLRLSCDTNDWGPDDRKTVTIQLFPAILLYEAFELTFFRQSQGDLVLVPSGELKLESELYYGETVSSGDDGSPHLSIPFVEVGNGDALSVLRLCRPEVVFPNPTTVNWLVVEWDRNVGDDEMIEIEAGRPERLRLTFDLSKMAPAEFPPNQPITATIRIRHFENEMSRTLRVVVPSVKVRPELKSFLAVDFGNTNTYATVALQDEGGNVRSVLGRGDRESENFPTVLYFTDLASNPGRPTFVIGDKAVVLHGERDPENLVRDLKPMLLADRVHAEQLHYVQDKNGHPDKLTGSTLILRFLEGVLRECERRERKTVTKLGLSYPANFSPRARAALDAVIVELADLWKADYPEYKDKIRFQSLTSDEASAVALGFVLDSAMIQSKIRPKLKQGRNPFLVASFDFGGGSIDCALLQFESEGTTAPTYRSTHLGIGGDERFGGDNVTLAVAELFAQRLIALLNAAAGPGRVELPFGRTRQKGSLPRRNSEHLREAAESLKRFLCEERPTQEHRDRLKNSLQAAVNRFRVRWSADDAGRSVQESVLTAVPELNHAVSSAIEKERLLVSLEEVYDHPLGGDGDGRSEYTVRGRLTRSVRKIRKFARRIDRENPPAPDFIVMAGAASRLPLTRALLIAEFPDAELIVDSDRAKSKVAFGLIRSLDMNDRFPDQAADLSVASDYTHAEIVWLSPHNERIVWVPSCSPLNQGAEELWYSLDDVRLTRCWNSNAKRRIDLYRDCAPTLEPIGWFDLSLPAGPSVPEGRQDRLPESIPRNVPSAVSLRFGRAEKKLFLDENEPFLKLDENELFLKVVLDGVEYGDWPLNPDDSAR